MRFIPVYASMWSGRVLGGGGPQRAPVRFATGVRALDSDGGLIVLEFPRDLPAYLANQSMQAHTAALLPLRRTER